MGLELQTKDQQHTCKLLLLALLYVCLRGPASWQAAIQQRPGRWGCPQQRLPPRLLPLLPPRLQARADKVVEPARSDVGSWLRYYLFAFLAFVLAVEVGIDLQSGGWGVVWGGGGRFYCSALPAHFIARPCRHAAPSPYPSSPLPMSPCALQNHRQPCRMCCTRCWWSCWE